MRAHATETSKDVGQVTAKHTTIRMELIDDDKSQVFEQLCPPRMMRQDTGVQHIRISQHEVSTVTHGASRILWGITIIGKRCNRNVLLKPCSHAQQLGELVLS